MLHFGKLPILCSLCCLIRKILIVMASGMVNDLPNARQVIKTIRGVAGLAFANRAYR